MIRLFSTSSFAWTLTCAALLLTPLSTASADLEKVCESGYSDPEVGVALWCNVSGAGNIAQANMVDAVRANLLVRDLQGLLCELNGYDELGTWVGMISTNANSGHLAVTDCFRNRSNECYERGAIAELLLSCFVNPEDTGGVGGV